MPSLFLDPALFGGDTVRIEGPDCHHLLNVLRIRAGENLTLLDGEGRAYYAHVEALEKRAVVARLLGPAPVAPEPALQITVAQALGKGDKFEQVVQHATEAGATSFVPLLTERTVVRIDASSAADKRERWRLIAKGAAEQSGRGRIPAVECALSLDKLASRFAEYDLALLLHPGGAPLHQQIASSPPRNALVLIGPEGGFSPDEVALAQKAGARVTSLGAYVLRTETAALVAVSQLLYAAALGGA